METNERVELLESARKDINSAIEKIKEAVKDTSNESYIERYLVGHLDNWANTESGTLDTTIPILIKELREKEDYNV